MLIYDCGHERDARASKRENNEVIADVYFYNQFFGAASGRAEKFLHSNIQAKPGCFKFETAGFYLF